LTSVYLVEGSWWHYDEGAVWIAAAFTTPEASEQWRVDCQAWIDQYVAAFWAAFVARFGEPERRCAGAIWLGLPAVDRYSDKAEEVRQFTERWFGDNYVLPEVQSVSPDPYVQCVTGEACEYRVVEVMLDPTGKTTVEAVTAQKE
jgi:hypothetical protein